MSRSAIPSLATQAPLLMLQKFGYQKVLTLETLGDNIKDCEYAVRGAIPILAE